MDKLCDLNVTISESKIKLLQKTIDAVFNPNPAQCIDQSSWVQSFEVIYEAAISLEPHDNEYIYLTLVTGARNYIKQYPYRSMKSFYSTVDVNSLTFDEIFTSYINEFNLYERKIIILEDLYAFFTKYFCKPTERALRNLEDDEFKFFPCIYQALMELWKHEIHDELINDYFLNFVYYFYMTDASSIFLTMNFYRPLICCIGEYDLATYFRTIIVMPLYRRCQDKFLHMGPNSETTTHLDTCTVNQICSYYKYEKSVMMGMFFDQKASVVEIMKLLRDMLNKGRERLFIDYFIDGMKRRHFKDEMILLFAFIADDQASRNIIIHALAQFVKDFLKETLKMEHYWVNKAFEQFFTDFTTCFDTCEAIDIMMMSRSSKFKDFSIKIFKDIMLSLENSEVYPNMVSYIVSNNIHKIMSCSKNCSRDLKNIIGDGALHESCALTNLLSILNEKSTLTELIYRDMGNRLMKHDRVQIEEEKLLCSFMEMHFISRVLHRFSGMLNEYLAFSSEKKEFRHWIRNKHPDIENFDLKILGSRSWPFTGRTFIKPLQQFTEKEEAINKYLVETKGTVVTNIHQTLSHGVLKFTVNGKMYKLSCNYIAMNILLLFNERNTLYKKKILDILHMSDKDCTLYMKGFLLLNLVLECEENGYTAYKLNKNFFHKDKIINMKIIYNDMEESGIVDYETPRNKLSFDDKIEYLSLLAQSKIMQIIKKERTMAESDLIQFVKQKFDQFDSTDELIKKQICKLVEKDYILRQGDSCNLVYKD